MARVELRGLTRHFDGGKAALDDLSFRIDDGEFVVVVGPSGCGKSTLLRLIAGLERPTQGHVLIDDTIVDDWAPQQRNVAMVFQNYALYPHMSVRQNMEFPLRMMRLTRAGIGSRIDRIAGLLDLLPLLDRKPKQLSGGQRQRVAMGRALVRNPAVLLLDEPLSNLDAQLRANIRTEIAALQRELGITTIHVTHDQQEAMSMGDRVAVLRDGKLQQLATPLELYDAPANTFVARFLGNPGMNISTATLRNDGGQLYLDMPAWNLYVGAELLEAYPRLQQYLHQRLQIGIRPEGFAAHTGQQAADRIAVHIEATEMLGHEMLVYCHPAGSARSSASAKTRDGNAGGTQWIVRLPADDTIRGNATLELVVDTGRLRLFRDDGTALVRAA